MAPSVYAVMSSNAAHDSDTMPGSDDMPTTFGSMPNFPTNPPDNFFSASNVSPAPVIVQPVILPPVAWSTAPPHADHEHSGRVKVRLPGLKELNLAGHEDSFNQKLGESANTRLPPPTEDGNLPATSLADPTTPEKGPISFLEQNDNCSSTEASRAFTHMLGQLRGSRAPFPALGHGQSLNDALVNVQAHFSVASIIEGSATVLPPPPGLSRRVVRSFIPLPSFDVAPTVALPRSPANANVEEHMQAWTPERPRRNWVLSEGSESVDMRDVSAQLVYDSPSTNFADSPSYYGRPAMMPGQFADEATAEAYMAHAESDFWARAAAAQRAESSLRFTHTVHSDVLHYDDSFLSLDDSLDRSPSPVLRAASPRRFLGTPARAWGATPETLVDSEGWTPGYYSDELQGSDGYAYGSDYGSQYGYMSSPIVRNPPGSVAPPGILGHIRDNDTSGEASNDNIRPITIRPFLSTQSGPIRPASPSSETADEADYLYGYRSTTPTPAPRANVSPTTTISALAPSTPNDLESNVSTRADQDSTSSVADFVQNDLSNSFSLLFPEDRPLSPPLEEQVPEDPMLARDTSELDPSFAFDYIHDHAQSPSAGFSDPSAYTLSGRHSRLSPGGNNTPSESFSHVNTLPPLVYSTLEAKQQTVPLISLVWAYVRPGGQMVWPSQIRKLLLLSEWNDYSDEEEIEGQYCRSRSVSLEEREVEAWVEQHQVLEGESAYEADEEDTN